MAEADQPKTPVKPLSQLKTPQDLNKKLEALQTSRALIERQWKINLAFYKGRQYTFWNARAQRLMALPVDDGEKPKHRVRIVSNQIVTGAQSLLAKYLKTKPQQFATPGSGSPEDLKAAQMADRLLEYWWEDLHLDDALEEVMLWTIIGSQGYWKVCWDDHAGKQMSFTIGPDGNPILDEHVKNAFRAQLAQFGVPPQEQTVYVGDIRIDPVSPFDLYIDPSAKRMKDAKWVIQSMTLDPDDIRVRYGKTLPANAVPTAPDESLPYGQKDTLDISVRRVHCMYVKPQAIMPKGRIVTWSGNEILEDKAWDYPTNDLPFVKFSGIRVPGSIYDSSVVEQAIPMQKELNRTLSQIVEYKNYTIRPQWMAPVGAMRTRRTDEPGAIWEYSPIAGLKPERIELPTIPNYMFEHLANIKGRLDEVFGKTEISEGGVPPNVEAGVAIDLLQEMATDRFVSTIRLMEHSIAQAGQLMLSLAKHYYIEPRLLKIRGSGGSTQVQEFTKSDIDGAISVHVETGSALPRTRAGRQARIQWLIDVGIVRPDDAYKYADLGDLKGLQDKFAADEDLAYRENEKMDQGQVLNPMAVQQAQQAIIQAQGDGINPDTQAPFQDMQEFTMWGMNTLQQASLAPGLLDDHMVHLDVHGMVMKSPGFQALPMEIQQAYNQHCQLHMEAYRALPLDRPQPEAVRTNLQIKSTVGPTGMAKILQNEGIDISPDEAAEPPLETWISDSVDKPDVDGSGPGQDGGVNLAKVAEITAGANTAAIQANAAMQQQAVHSSADLALKQQKARHAEEMHRAKLAQAQKPPPKASGGQK